MFRGHAIDAQSTVGYGLDDHAMAAQIMLSEPMHESAMDRQSIQALLCDEAGAELVEWVLLTITVGLAGIATLVAVRGELADAFQHVIDGFLQ